MFYGQEQEGEIPNKTTGIWALKGLRQLIKSFFGLVMNMKIAIPLFIRLLRLQKKYELHHWFILPPFVKPQVHICFEWIRKNLSRDIKILELGCAICGWSAMISTQGFRDLIAVDISASRLRIGKILLTHYKPYPLIGGDSQAIPLQKGIFDLVVIVDVVSAFPSINLKACLVEISRVLKPRGFVLIDFYQEASARYFRQDVSKSCKDSKLEPINFIPIHRLIGCPFGYLLIAQKE